MLLFLLFLLLLLLDDVHRPRMQNYTPLCIDPIWRLAVDRREV
jgi:hypothetical protein